MKVCQILILALAGGANVAHGIKAKVPISEGLEAALLNVSRSVLTMVKTPVASSRAKRGCDFSLNGKLKAGVGQLPLRGSRKCINPGEEITIFDEKVQETRKVVSTSGSGETWAMHLDKPLGSGYSTSAMVMVRNQNAVCEAVACTKEKLQGQMSFTQRQDYAKLMKSLTLSFSKVDCRGVKPNRCEKKFAKQREFGRVWKASKMLEDGYSERGLVTLAATFVAYGQKHCKNTFKCSAKSSETAASGPCEAYACGYDRLKFQMSESGISSYVKETLGLVKFYSGSKCTGPGCMKEFRKAPTGSLGALFPDAIMLAKDFSTRGISTVRQAAVNYGAANCLDGFSCGN